MRDCEAALENSPDDANFLSLRAELQGGIAELENAISILKASQAPQRSPSPPAPEVAAEEPKWSRANHPAFQPGYKKPGAAPEPVEALPQAPVKLNVNDTVMAKWVSGDKAFYAARITSITGSSAAPIYTVMFKGYNNSETLRGNDIKATPNDSKKRKADPSSVAPPPPPPVQTPGVISAAADINPDLVEQAHREPSKVSDGPARPAKVPRKVKGNKEYEATKSKWQEFSTKGKVGKTGKKESMFRTGEGFGARGEQLQRLI